MMEEDNGPSKPHPIEEVTIKAEPMEEVSAQPLAKLDSSW